MNTAEFNNNLTKYSNQVAQHILDEKLNLDLSAVEVDPNLNCFENYLMHRLKTFSNCTISLKKFYKSLNDIVLKDNDLRNQALIHLAQDCYIYIRKDLFQYTIMDNHRKWTDLICDHNQENHVETRGENNLKVMHSIIKDLHNTQATIKVDGSQIRKVEKLKDISDGQKKTLEQFLIIENVITPIFIHQYLANEKIDSTKRKKLEELEKYNYQVLKVKQKQFEELSKEEKVDQIENTKKAFSTNLSQDIMDGLLNGKLSNSSINYFDKDMNCEVEKESEKVFKKLGWEKIKEIVISHHEELFGFLNLPNEDSKSRLKSRLSKTKTSESPKIKPTKSLKKGI